VTYLDTGCFVKLYYPEPDSAKVVALIQGKPLCYTPLRRRWQPANSSPRIHGRRSSPQRGRPVRLASRGVRIPPRECQAGDDADDRWPGLTRRGRAPAGSLGPPRDPRERAGWDGELNENLRS